MIWQPWEYVIICGAALGTFVVANPMKTIKDTGKAPLEAFRNDAPTMAEHIELLSLLFFMMRELRDKSRAEMEMIIDAPQESEVFKRSPERHGQRGADDLHLRLFPPDHHGQRADP